MNAVEALRRRRVSAPAIVLIALTSAGLAVTTSGANETHAAGAHHEALIGAHGHTTPAHALTARQLAFHDAMRKLWEDHITWTRLAIVSFAGGLPDLQATEARLLANQVDIGNAIKPYYGSTAGNRLTALLKDHILGAVALLQAAKSGDQTAIGKASGVVRQRQPDRRLPARRQPPRVAEDDDAGDDEDTSRPDAGRGAAPPPRQLRR